ncbi:zeta toxin family protein [Desertivirga brevis]|uniref:zeta toxin family protein n=1 Tax=Desertivirga brevis TaxID=2810310 RepID=UPI001A970FED|nr:zeta toxin family protein [Pedobacter sp. SYSU D00873]
MSTPELVFVTGPNAVGKSSFIRSRISQLETFDILMTDVFKGRIFELFDKSIKHRRDIILETVFNDPKFSKLVDKAKDAGYFTQQVQLFLDSPNKSLDRANRRRILENGLAISKDTVLINFNENFKNFSHYYFYFDRTDLIYNGGLNEAENLITFKGMELLRYQSNDFNFIKRFAEYSFQQDRMDKATFDIIMSNQSFSNISEKIEPEGNLQRRFKL